MNQRWQQIHRNVKPGLQIIGKLALLSALRFGPAGVAGWAVKSVARRPVKLLLAFALEPLLKRTANKFSRRFMSQNEIK